MSSIQQNPASVRLVHQFLDAIAARDIGTIDAKYHESISFSSPLYPDLRKERVVNAWSYMLEQFEMIKIDRSVMFADERKAQVRWCAYYVSSARSVKLEGTSTFSFWDDQIVRQVDEWRFGSWARQHFGLKGLLFAWMPMFERRCKEYAVQAITLDAQSRR